MYYVEFRGLGLLGAIPPVLGLVGLAAMMEHTFRAAALTATLTIALSGAALVAADRFVRKEGHRNSLYGIPLWFWGAFWALGGAGLAGWIGVLVSESGWRD